MVSVDDFEEVRECDYKDEHYAVRDNGAVFRFPKEGKRKRKYDEVWTFGEPNIKTGYAHIGCESVHRIVAFAFLGNPPTSQHVVDHIDTNRQNNRPSNLRWVTKLENVLNNPITRARIENICGSIEAFLEDPSILRGYEHVDSNFNWMRAVTPEEAKISKERLLEWAENRPLPTGGTMGEWVFTERSKESFPPVGQSSYNRNVISSHMPPVVSRNVIPESYPPYESAHDWNVSNEQQPPLDENIIQNNAEEADNIGEQPSNETVALTPNAVQIDWRIPSEFPFCPKDISEHPLKDYYDNNVIGLPFCTNDIYTSLVERFALADNGNSLIVMTTGGNIKPWALAKVTVRDDKFVHQSLGSYFHEDGALKYFTIAKGEKWEGGEVFDDLC